MWWLGCRGGRGVRGVGRGLGVLAVRARSPVSSRSRRVVKAPRGRAWGQWPPAMRRLRSQEKSHECSRQMENFLPPDAFVRPSSLSVQKGAHL